MDCSLVQVTQIYYRQEEVSFWLCTTEWLPESPNGQYQSHVKKASLGHQYTGQNPDSPEMFNVLLLQEVQMSSSGTIGRSSQVLNSQRFIFPAHIQFILNLGLCALPENTLEELCPRNHLIFSLSTDQTRQTLQINVPFLHQVSVSKRGRVLKTFEVVERDLYLFLKEKSCL